MQQRQLRLGDILDDYCPRERRLTNHAIVAMVGDAVKRTRCTTCDDEHEFKHATLPRQRRKTEPAALAVPAAAAPKRVAHDSLAVDAEDPPGPQDVPAAADAEHPEQHAAIPHDVPSDPASADAASSDDMPIEPGNAAEEGPVHRRLIRAQLPRIEGQPPAARPAPDFTIRQPGGRPNRFRPRQQHGGGGSFFGDRSNGGNQPRDSRGGQRPPGGRPGANNPRHSRRQGRKRSK
jgi:hypothetical protein